MTYEAGRTSIFLTGATGKTRHTLSYQIIHQGLQGTLVEPSSIAFCVTLRKSRTVSGTVSGTSLLWSGIRTKRRYWNHSSA